MPKGKYIKVAFTVNGKRYYVYGKTKRETKEKELALRQKIESNTYQKGKALTYDQFFQRWHDDRRESVSGQTMRQELIFHTIVAGTPIDEAGTTFGTMKITDIERQNVLDLQKALTKREKAAGGKLSARTINGILSLVKQVFDAAMLDRLIQWNPANGIKPVKQTTPPARDTIHRALTIDETRRFLSAAAGSWYEPLFRFLLSSGCRIGEAGALKPSRIKRDKIIISCTVTRAECGSYEIGDDTKTAAGKRTIPCTPDIKAALDAQRRQNTIAFGNVINLETPIFRSPRGAILRESRVNIAIAKACQEAGIEKFTAHAFRDTFATRAIESKMNPKTLQEILGHSDIQMTMNLYAHVMEDTKKQEMQIVNVGVG